MVMNMTRKMQVVLSVLFLVLFGVIVRIGLLTVDESVKLVGQTQGARTITVSELRGTIYDRHCAPLVNNKKTYFATMIPDERLLQHIAVATDSTEYSRVRSALGGGFPLLVRLNHPVHIAEGLHIHQTTRRYDDSCPAPHLIGYLGGPGVTGASGIEKAYDSILNQYIGRITATYPINGHGEYMGDDRVEVVNTSYRSAGGVVLTLDSAIQAKVEEVLSETVEKGAVVVMQPNGEILAMASYPDFHPDTVAENLDRTDGALINRAVSVYDCGSVFKIVTALAALESGVSAEQTFACAGALTIDNNTFHCHHRLGHDILTMDEAFAQSCNLYFIQLAQQIGADALLDMTEKLGLADALAFADTLSTDDPVLPTGEDLSAPAALANFSFGQGRLLLSPLHIARMTAAVANDGILPTVSAVIGLVDEYKQWTDKQERGGEMAVSATSAASVRRMMELVVSDGTGRRAQPDVGVAAGKTGTAETGRLQGEKTAVNSWFTGYYPADNPQYIVTVLVEDSGSGSPSAAEIFCEIINKIG